MGNIANTDVVVVSPIASRLDLSGLIYRIYLYSIYLSRNVPVRTSTESGSRSTVKQDKKSERASQQNGQKAYTFSRKLVKNAY